jgi:CRP-like cAMP-binding protein
MTWQKVLDWAQTHYRGRLFNKDEKIPAREGLVYIVNKGAIRIVGRSNFANLYPQNFSTTVDETFLGFVTPGQAFEIINESFVDFQAYAHLERTSIIWFYWRDLDNWPIFRQEIADMFRYQHQRKLSWLNSLAQKRTIDRLIGFLTFLVEEHGELTDDGYCIPYALTHIQIGNAIGSTRVTVTRLMGKLRDSGLIVIKDDNLIYFPNFHLR